MKNIKNFNDFKINEMLKWDKSTNYTDYYFIYDLNTDELQKYLNNWFEGEKSTSKSSNKVLRDELITLKKCDEETTYRLYSEVYNPVSINIMCPTGARFKQNVDGVDLYEMKAQIHSLDDASYGIWWSNYGNNSLPIEDLYEIREKIVSWLDSKDEVNGEEFLDYCESLGAVDRDYN